MNFSTCLGDRAGKAWCWTTKVALLIAPSSYPQRASAAICLLESVSHPRIAGGGLDRSAGQIVFAPAHAFDHIAP
jgi:hypothetical protein